MVERPHVPVLLDAVRECASAAAGEVWVDCTLGFGGHSEALLQAGARVIGFDRDAAARAYATDRLSPHAERLTIVASDFRRLPTVLAELGVERVDGVLADLGVSSWQLDQPERGFSFKAPGPVDMRMDPAAGEPALALIERSSTAELADVIRRYGEERFAGPIARAIRAWVEGPGPHDTHTLAQAVRDALPKREAAKRKIHPATQTFQALRIAVNDELGALEDLLAALPEVLAPGGRALIISFHSLEDR
ncbi:MAG: 16S rRNA (cytosine(1402)-N(4))-methyltransferase RsmH, partial [Myxococcales bacterium]|nr:16S rRNA (cytosine(1402)-N(4))-methyltransferase RsmH [Myxococcales bacterium]